jgi:hypothetical protein
MFDFTKFDGKKPSLEIAEGIHECSLEKTEMKTDKNGNQYLSLWWRLTGTRQVVFDLVVEPDDKNKLNLFKIWRLAQIFKFALGKKDTLTTLQAKLNKCIGEIVLVDVAIKQNGEYTNNTVSAKKEMFYALDASPAEVAEDTDEPESVLD